MSIPKPQTITIKRDWRKCYNTIDRNYQDEKSRLEEESGQKKWIQNAQAKFITPFINQSEQQLATNPQNYEQEQKENEKYIKYRGGKI